MSSSDPTTMTFLFIFTAVLVVMALLVRKGKLRGKHYFLACLLLLVGFISVQAYRMMRLKPGMDTFQAQVERYATFKGPPSGDIYLRGKLVVVSSSSKQIHNLYYDLPVSLKATAADEVGTVAQLECYDSGHIEQKLGGNTVNSYCDSASCELTLIDWSIPATLGVQRFKEIGMCKEVLMNTKVMTFLKELPSQ